MDLSWLKRPKPHVAMLLLLFLAEYLGPALAPQGLNLSPLEPAASNENFRYEFIVDDEGAALVRIICSGDVRRGSSWVLVPKFSGWLNYTINGRITSWSLEDTGEYIGLSLYFYNVLTFSYVSTGQPFVMVIEYNFSLAAMVVESESTYGIFYSPQIGFEWGSDFEALVIFPKRFRARLNEALAIGGSGYYEADMELSNASHVFFRGIPASENLLRIQIGFDAVDGKVEPITLRSGIFEFSTVARYREHAHKIMNLYNATYDMLTNLFNTTLEGVTVRFFIPNFYSLMSVGGYVPFTGDKLGDIYINLVFARYIEGYMEVIALHELIHHFLWKAGISPGNLLWFHEGMAQYLSVEVAERIGYEGAKEIRRRLEEDAEKIRLLLRDDFGFLKGWTPYNEPEDIGIFYAASYYVVSRLAENRGGLSYYARFFRLLSGRKMEDNVMLCYYLSLAAGESVFRDLNSWGFNLPDIYAYQPLIAEVEEAIRGIDPSNPLLQPFRGLAELIYGSAISGRAPAEAVQLYLLAALFIARYAPTIALLSYSFIAFAALLALLKLKGVFR